MRRFASVNAWIVGPKGRQIIVDTGMCGAETETLWRLAEDSGDIDGVEALLVTHMHRDHAGQVLHLRRRFQAPLHMSAREHSEAMAASIAEPEDSRPQLRGFLLALGMDAPAAEAATPIDYSMLAPFPEVFVALQEGQELSLGGQDWHVMLGGGHSAGAACLMAKDQSLFLSGDQILPGAGPHITVWPATPDADPLADYFVFLDRLIGLPDHMLVLPGHGAPFTGLPSHAWSLKKGHQERLAKLETLMSGAMTCMEMAPKVFSERAMQRFADLIPAMTLSLANHLWHRGDLRRHRDDNGLYLFEKRVDSRSP